MTGLIYKWQNLINNKVYIGQTIRSLEIRTKEHIAASKIPKLPFHYAINKYGISNFQIDIIDQIEDSSKKSLLDRLNNLEIKYIKDYNCLVPKGYNVEIGGNNHVCFHVQHDCIISNIENASIIDTQTNIVYDNVVSWLYGCKLDVEEQYKLINPINRFQIINPELYIYWGECFPKDATIKDILDGKAHQIVYLPCNFQVSSIDERIGALENEYKILKKKLEKFKAMKKEIEELRKENARLKENKKKNCVEFEM